MAHTGEGDTRVSWSSVYSRQPQLISKQSFIPRQCQKAVSSAVCCTVMHPFTYCKTLVQFGHEPMEPKLSKNWLGTPVLMLPSIFQYIRHVKRREGFTGCYRGLSGNIATHVVRNFTYDYVERWMNTVDEESSRQDDEESDGSQKVVAKRILKQVCVHGVSIVVSQPFHVITCRMMVQFIGQETKYNGIFGSIREIYHSDGILGFFAGIVPKLIGDITLVALTQYTNYWINRLVSDPNVRTIAPYITSMVCSSVMYPFTIVSNCMAVNDCGLVGGVPPHMPLYADWTQCYSHLRSIGQLNRGGSLGGRYYVSGPTAIILASSLRKRVG
ncbi:unnamed protein product [Notodromas monacha]|uniref:Mitochondrial carrier homolog 2 n=1 Tax=Notodromas monacha TaxID=399045 RepID=A0A7R9G9X8_9CRUS|nr:unnamed protein product [Notodromas monacha]CAG0913412.1 unnamed protein product [Notodromas monacha]